MRPASQPCALIALVTLAIACSSSSNPAEPGPAPGPTPDFDVEATLAFGDPPLQGAIRIIPSTNAIDWQFAVDVDDDGESDEIGFIDDGVSVFYRFETPGTHRVRTTIERGGQRFQFEDLLSVNDPRAVRQLARVQVDHRAIVIASHDGSLYVGTDTELLQLDESTRSIERRLGLDDEVDLLSVASDGSRVFVAQGNSVLVVDPDDLTIQKRLEVTTARALTLLGLNGGRLIAGSHDGLVLVDTESGEVRDQIDTVARHLSLSGGGTTIAVAEFDFESAGVRVIDVGTFETRWAVSFDPDIVQPALISFSPDDRRIYMLDRGAERRLVVFDAATGDVVQNAIVSDRCGLTRCQEAFTNPSASLFGDRFVVFPTDIGAYFVDTRQDLRLLRLGTDGDSRLGCCSVAQSSDKRRLFILSDVFIDVVDVPGS